MENIVRAVAAGPGRWLRIGRVALHTDASSADLVVGLPGGREWHAVDSGAARVVLTLREPELGA
ncbi:hypothetical protein ABZ260_31595 [Streptosporangium sp. NPDC006013]|uniref:hypothetical protein n=1 Tax=Streptosporangium sp. NPDC006013 TaxID=3155596 RepID=UPI0033A5A7BF